MKNIKKTREETHQISTIRIFIILCMAIFLIGFASSTLENLGTFKQNEEIRIMQVCSDATNVNISSITFPDSSVAVSAINMSHFGNGEYYYNFSLANFSGRYNVNGVANGCEKTFSYYFNVTPYGWTSTFQFYIIAIVIIALLFIIGFKLQNTWVMSLASILVLILGFFIIINGIDVIKDQMTTWAIGLVVLFAGIYFMYLSVEEQLKNWNFKD